ncbi:MULTISPECIES: ImmA/IrrE family metallo-endopeptidase [Streptomyces]|uniref:IrrE N-terminal-like domain-containing protein n=1 Tax=Streptomyces stelliscabiei TaxID=146820 RepID=A0A8I0P7V3_9ACTN|nr:MULTISPECIES: ImmA/IrrE family metallo-endopeptidase [Streptomyces]MBE1598817.1 hypothetical protein [Streptomyces stelliscabiei]MDX2516396.1 ImmA/IrrE family metallo-endopeptidase [Streptomyces stelliscabiei]SOD75915.1 protein of unknown function [Streptomyces sp. 1222.2]
MAVRERQLRRYCRRLLRHLDIRPPLDVHELCKKIGQYRGKEIRLIPWELPIPGPSGVWLSQPGAETIFYQRETSSLHQDHIILHEIGHILADHENDLITADVFSDPGPDFPELLLNQGFQRTSYSEDYEYEAELVATIIQEWAVVMAYVTPCPPEDPALHPLRSALNPRLGWL